MQKFFTMEERLASAATLNSCSSDIGQTVQIMKSPPLFDGEGNDFTKPCENSSTGQEAKGLEGKEETDEVTLNLKSAPKLDAREISLDKVSSEEFEPERESPVKVSHRADEPGVFQIDDSGFFSDGVESIEAGSEVDSSSQQSTDAPLREPSSQSLRRGEMEDVVPSETLNERTECFHLAEAGGKEHQSNGKRENSIDNVQRVKCRITEDDEEIVEIKSWQNQKPSKKTPRKLISYQEFFRILRKALRESKLPKLVYNFFARNKKYFKKCLKRFPLSNLRLNENDVCVVFPVWHLQSGWDWTTGSLDMKNEWFRLYSFASLTCCRFQKLSFVSLATAGFYYSSEHKKIQCFTCDKCYTPEHLEYLLQACGTSNLPKGLHEKWCLISDHGNIPIHPNPICNDIGLYLL